MTAIAGNGGAVKSGSNTVAELDQWSLNVDADLYDTTAFGVSWHSFIAGLKGATGSASGRWYMGDTNGQKTFQDAILGGTTISSLVLTTNGTNTYSGAAFIKQLQAKADVQSTVDVTFNFQYSGTVTYA